jgi:nitrite reductase (NADH) small subunit
MSEFQAVAKLGDIPEGEGRAFPVDGKMIALFLHEGQYKAVSDTCPHMGASLATGYVENNAVLCPWHAWKFCIREGTWLDNPGGKVCLNTYEVKIENDDILVERPKKREEPKSEE